MAKHVIKLNGTSSQSFQVGLQGATISSEEVSSPYSLVLPPALGTVGQALILDANTNLVFGNVSSGGSVTNVPYIDWVASTDGQTQFVDEELSQYPSGTELTIFRNGVLMHPEEYSVSGNTLTVSTYVSADDEIEIPSRGITATGNVEYANASGVAYSVAAANIVGTVSFATNSTNAGSATTAGFATIAATANSVSGANVTGEVANATYATSAGSATSANSATTADIANSVAGANVTGTVANATYATSAGSATTADIANSVAAANITGTINFATNSTNANVANIANTATNANFANFADNVTLAAQANITSVGTLTSLTVNGMTSLKGYTETTVSASSAGTFAPDLADGTIQRFTATSAFTFNGFTNPIAGQNGVFVITQDATGGRVMTTTMKFVGGSKTLSTAAGAVDIIGVFYDGITYYASLTKDYR